LSPDSIVPQTGPLALFFSLLSPLSREEEWNAQGGTKCALLSAQAGP